MSSILMELLMKLLPEIEKAILEKLKAYADASGSPLGDEVIAAVAAALGITL